MLEISELPLTILPRFGMATLFVVECLVFRSLSSTAVLIGGNTIYFVSYLHPLCLTLQPFPAFRVVFNRRLWMDRFLIYVDSEWGIDIYSHTCVTPSIGSRPSMVLANVWILCIHVPNSKISWAPMLPKAQQILSGDGTSGACGDPQTLRNVLGNIFEHLETPDVRCIVYIYNHWLI